MSNNNSKPGDKAVVLPSAQEIMQRLAKVDMGANAYMAERFYPSIAKEGGRQLVASGIVLMLSLKVHDFVASGYPPMMEGIMQMYVPKFIDVLVDDMEVAEEARRFHQEAMDAVGKDTK